MNNTLDIFNGPAMAAGCSALLLCLSVQRGKVVLVMTHITRRTSIMYGLSQQLYRVED